MDFDNLDGDALNRAIAARLRWREIMPGKWLRPLDNNSTPRMVMTKLSNWAGQPSFAIQHLIDDGFGFAITYNPNDELLLTLDSSELQTFTGDQAWHNLQLTIIRAWLKWRAAQDE